MTDNTQYQDNEGELDVPEQPLTNDFDTPAAPPEEKDDEQFPKDHPSLDTNIDEHETYDEGVVGASGTDDQHVDEDDTSQPERIA